ncbi:MAG TPA: quinoprotein dehydrogenase-associated SoxYZ-like carrier, partial [Burkholderiaceae bacterium]|nr:quinoprotein dehydrogenase-associated SoxYZ-like carrier [Burkholderiaceae bacterium]
MGSTSPSRRCALRGLGALALAPSSVWPAVGGLPSATHDASSPEWQQLSERLFPGRQLIAGQGTVQLIAPLRAAYGASVPVKVVSKLPQRPELHV